MQLQTIGLGQQILFAWPDLDNLLAAQAGRSTSSGSSTAGTMGAGFAITLRAHIGKSDSSFSVLLTSHNARSIFLPCCYWINNHKVFTNFYDTVFNNLYNAIMESFFQKLYKCTCSFFHYMCVRELFFFTLSVTLTSFFVKFQEHLWNSKKVLLSISFQNFFF